MDSASPAGRRLRQSALVCGQLLIVAAAVWVLSRVLAGLAAVVIPVAIALLCAALLAPVVSWLTRRHLPRALAEAIVLLGGVASVTALLWFVTKTLIAGLPSLRAGLTESYARLRDWLTTGPLKLSGEQLDRLTAQVSAWVSGNRRSLVSGAWGAFSTAGSVLVGIALAIFVLVFFSYDGARIWRTLIRSLPDPARDRVGRAGVHAFGDLTAFMYALIVVAAVDAIAIGLGLWLAGVPLVLPLAALVFLGAFVPLIGAFVSGLVAVLVAFVLNGPITALVVAAIVIGVQQLEGNVLSPLITSNAVRLHPVAVILAIAIGIQQAGVIGALLAVPLLVVVRAVVTTLTEPNRNDEPGGEKNSARHAVSDQPEEYDDE